MEQLLHYVWKHRLYDDLSLSTTSGESVQVINPGMHNMNSGPDFLNAKVRMGNLLWAGNVEIHTVASDWYRHGHNSDRAYDNTILHVVEKGAYEEAVTSDGRSIPTLFLSIPKQVADNYEELLRTSEYPRCYKVIPTLPAMKIHSWLSSLLVERVAERAELVRQRAEQLGGDWEHAFIITLARNFGFGKNGDEFEQWAKALPLNSLAHHRDDRFQIESAFLGVAGLLTNGPKSHIEEGRNDEHRLRMLCEYNYLRAKFSLPEDEKINWKFMRMRPNSFPHIRISQLADLYCRGAMSLSAVVDCASISDYESLMDCCTSEYWHTHYAFGCETEKYSVKRLSVSSRHLIIINTVVPVLWAYGRHQKRQELCDRALALLDALQCEQNYITRQWHNCGITVHSAADSQALIQLKNTRCDRYDCLRCRFAYEYLKA